MKTHKIIRILSDHSKMMLLLSHMIMIVNTMNLALAINAERSEVYSFNMIVWIAGLVAFIIIQTKFSKES